MAGTTIRSVLPSPLPPGSPTAIVIAWSGASLDVQRSRLMVWGGGHLDYFGNELYAINLPALSVQRLTDPSPLAGTATCTSALADGTPASRHTYAGLAYVAHQDQLVAVGGSLSRCGNPDEALWAFNVTSSQWTNRVPKVPVKSLIGVMSAYDAEQRRVLIKDAVDFWSFNPDNGMFTQLNTARWVVDYRMNAALDTKRRQFVMIGDGLYIIDLAKNTFRLQPTTNAPTLVTSRQAPGLAYDAYSDRMVAWHGGSEVWSLDMDTYVWTQVAVNSGPRSAAPTQGTFGRWAYVPQYGVFMLVNSIDENAWVFRLYT